MKKIKYFLLTLVVGSFLTSCYSDDAINEVPVAGLEDLSLSVAGPNSATGEGFVVPFTATLPKSFSEDATVQARLDFEGGFVTNTVTIPAGSTSGSGTVSMQGNDGLSKFSGREVKLSLSGVALADQSGIFNITSNEVALTSFDRVQWPYGAATIAGRMTALFDFANPGSNDLDMLIYSDAFDLVESAASGSRWETDIFNDTHPDGGYFVAIDFWIASGDIPWKLFFVDPDQTTVTDFSGTFTNVTETNQDGNGDFIFPLINITKSTDGDGNVSYTYAVPTKKSFSKAQIEKMRSQIERRK